MQRVKDFLQRCKDEWNYPEVEPVLARIDLFEDSWNEDACRICGGKCCKQGGCPFSPRDFLEISFLKLRDEIAKGYISIAYFPKGEKYCNPFKTGVFFLRMRNKGAPIVDIYDESHGECILLTETGCPFSFENRPFGGKALLPRMHAEPDGEGYMFFCGQEYSTKDICFEWLPFKRILHELALYFADGTQVVPEK